MRHVHNVFTVTPETNKVCSQRVSFIAYLSSSHRWCKSYRKSKHFLEKLPSMLPITLWFLIEMKPWPNWIFTNWTENLLQVIRQDNKLCVSILGEVGNIQWDSCQGWRDHFSPGHPIPTAMPAQKLFASHRSTPLLHIVLQVTFFRIVKQMTLIPDDPGRVLCPSQFQPSHRLLPHCRS